MHPTGKGFGGARTEMLTCHADGWPCDGVG